jgi:hypothetical protein
VLNKTFGSATVGARAISFAAIPFSRLSSFRRIFFLMEACVIDPGTLNAIAAIIGALAYLLAELRKWRR